MIRGTCLLNYRESGCGPGCRSGPANARSRCPAPDAGDNDAFMSYTSLVVAVESAARATGVPDFGRRLALRQGIEILGPVGVAARTAPTTGDALATCVRYLSAYSPSISVSLVPLAYTDHVRLDFQILARELPPHTDVVELSLGVELQVVRYLRGQDFHPVSVHLWHAPLTDESSYRAHFDCPAHFAEPVAGLTLRRADLAKAVSDDAQAHEAITRYRDTIVGTEEPGTVPPVRRLVRQLLPTGAVSPTRMARQFALRPKTLQRRLAGEGTTFAALVDDCRRELAEHYLRDTDLSLTQVARELGYGEQSVLTRSCNRWHGASPASLRANASGLRANLAGSRVRNRHSPVEPVCPGTTRPAPHARVNRTRRGGRHRR